MLFLFCFSSFFFEVFGSYDTCFPYVPPSAEQNSWTFTLYTRSNSFGTSVLQNSNPNDKTVVIVHGWTQKGDDRWILDMKDAYLTAYPANVIVVDWNKSAAKIRTLSAYTVPYVGRKLAEQLHALHNSSRVNIVNTELVGFSLGGHVVGVAGQEFFSLSGGRKVGRILGLDASWPKFNDISTACRLDVTDADFVQAFHTSIIGMFKSYGKIDVYFNDNIGCSVWQPGCPGKPGVNINILFTLPVLCEHIRAVAYATESISSNNLLAVNCTCESVSEGNCRPIYFPVGDKALSSTPPGAYFVRTASSKPFVLGQFTP